MKKQNFFSWYYDNAVAALLEIWKNFILFFWKYFSIWDLFRTLVSPWRKDITFKNWRGWHIEKSIQVFIENIFSRVIGMLVRLTVIIIGLTFIAVLIIVGFLIITLWIGAPIIIIFLFFLTFGKQLLFFSTAAYFIFWGLLAYAAYSFYLRNTIYSLDFDSFYGHNVAKKLGTRFGFGSDSFPASILENPEEMKKFFKKQNITVAEFQHVLKWEFKKEEERHLKNKFWRKEYLDKIQPIGSQWKFAYTVRLDNYSTDLSTGDTSEYSETELIGREGELEITKLILQRPDQNCVLLVGGSGVGKKTLLHHLARSIRENKIDNSFKNMRILLLDLGRAISDSISNGQDVENNMRMLFHEAAYAGNIILAVEHIENFLGKEGNIFHPNLSSVFSEYLNIQSFQIIATSTPYEYHQMIEKQAEIVKYFEVVEMSQPNEQQVLDILLDKMQQYEKNRIIFTYVGLKAIIRESDKFNWEFPMPERAIDLAMDTLMYWQKKGDGPYIDEKTVFDFVSLKTGIPQGEIGGEEKKKLLNLEKTLHNFVIGQEEAVREVAQALRRTRSGIGNSQKPIGSFLFFGPTGVGKTETAKALAKAYFGDEKKMIRFDMSEFQAPSSIDRMIGSSQLNQKGRLTTEVKDNPYSLILLDEIEKAYPEVLDIFLQILDEGFVTDAFGEKINFRNSIIIATSNAGAPLIKNMVEDEKGPEEIKQAVIDFSVQNNIFRVEFLNRFTGVVFFRPLKELELKSVVRLLLQKFAKRVQKEKNLEIEFDETVVDNMIEKGYSPIFGARSLEHYIEHTVEDLVATKIIEGELKRGEKMLISI